MAEVQLPDAYKVEVIEYEHDGWATQRLELRKYFDSEEEAKQFADDYNKESSKHNTPSLYYKAYYKGKVV